MSSTTPEVVNRIDQLVAQLDAATIEEPFSPLATSSYAVMIAAWVQFKALVDILDAAVADPFAPSAARGLRGAIRLVDDRAYKLAFWLTHVADALAQLPRKR